MAKTAILSVRITSIANSAGFKKATRDIEAFKKKADRLDSGLSSVGAKMARTGRAIGAALAPVAKIGAIAGTATVGLGGLAPILAAVGSAAVAAIGPMIALGAAMAPAALASAGLAIGTVKLAVEGLGDAITATSPEDFAKALEALSPSAQIAATSLRDLKTQFDEIGPAVQEAFFANLSNLDQLGVLITPLREAMTGLAMDMGNAAAGLVDFVSQGTGLSAVRTLLYHSSTAAGSLSYAFADVLRGIIAVGAAASPIFAEMAAKIAEVASAWADKMVAAFQDGSLQEFFRDAVEKARALWEVLTQLGGIVSGVFSAMSAAGQPFLGHLGQIIAYTNEWVNSAQGMSTLTSLFGAMAGAVSALLPIIGQIAGIIGGTLAPVIADVITTVAPVLSEIVGVLGQIISALMPIIPPIAQLVAMIGQALAGALQAIMPIIAAVASIIADALGQALKMLEPLMPVIVDAFVQLAQGMQPLLPAFAELIQAVLSLLPPIVKLAMAVIPGLVKILIALMPAIIAVIKGVVDFANGIRPLIEVAARLAGPVLGALAAIIGVVARVLAPLIQLAVRLYLEFQTGTRVIGILKGALGGLKSAFGIVQKGIDGAKNAFNSIKGAIESVVNVVGRLIGKIGSIRWPKPPSWLGKVLGTGDDGMGFSAPPAPPSTGGLMQAAAGDYGFLGGQRSSSGPVHVDNSIHITVDGSGIVDARAVAEAVRKAVQIDGRDRGLIAATGGSIGWA